ncbi:MAG TPA: sigma-54 dependent transcriptional regulator [Planctomycetota bacterium]|nr:sigma-54 dependent transcriptional regulator [Planctomycetota bacterium]
MAAAGRILIVEDETHMARTLELLLKPRKHRIAFASTGEEGVQAARLEDFDVVLLDIMLPDLDGLKVLEQVRRDRPATQVIMLTAKKDVKTAVEAMKKGAYDYLQKPVEEEDLLMAVDRALEKRRLEREVNRLRTEVAGSYELGNIVGESPAMRPVFDLIKRSGPADSNVLILGETGTGKELIARAIHYQGPRRGEAFVPFNCARYTDTLIESDLFGHEAGAFTGASRMHRGKFEQANGGTLFLDEIGLMPAQTQARLLRVLEDRRVERVGGEAPIEVDVRIIAATNASLEELVAERKFREDLYYRLKVIKIAVPPLRDRKEDIEPLVQRFLARFCEKTGKPLKRLDADGMAVLRSYDWPGNVRELENLMEMLVVLVDGPEIPSMNIVKELFSRMVTDPAKLSEMSTSRSSIDRVLVEFERRLLEEALVRNCWNKVKTAQELGWHRNTIDYKLKKLGLVRPESS